MSPTEKAMCALRRAVRSAVTGLTIPQEYVCLERPTLEHPLSVFLDRGDGLSRVDVTRAHLFVGYKPLLIALPFAVMATGGRVERPDRVTLSFENVGSVAPRVLGTLSLRRLGERDPSGVALLLYRGEHGAHSLLRPWHQQVNRARERLRRRRAGNVDLPGNLIEQVRLAYSIPRLISLITVSDGEGVNMFPTDLHGEVQGDVYVGSLRTSGLANTQVEGHNRVVISEIAAPFFREAYALGKNHMRPMSPETQFSLSVVRSRAFGLPLPVAVTRYRELERLGAISEGIHRVHLYRLIHSEVTTADVPSLSHVHQYYAQWRMDRHLATPMLLR